MGVTAYRYSMVHYSTAYIYVGSFVLSDDQTRQTLNLYILRQSKIIFLMKQEG
jgi:hypothetical protein